MDEIALNTDIFPIENILEIFIEEFLFLYRFTKSRAFSINGKRNKEFVSIHTDRSYFDLISYEGMFLRSDDDLIVLEGDGKFENIVPFAISESKWNRSRSEKCGTKRILERSFHRFDTFDFKCFIDTKPCFEKCYSSIISLCITESFLTTIFRKGKLIEPFDISKAQSFSSVFYCFTEISKMFPFEFVFEDRCSLSRGLQICFIQSYELCIK